MSSVSQNFMKLFRGSSGPETTPAQGSQKLTRRSSGLGELSRAWESSEGLCILDLGSTSATNIRHFTERGHRIYSEDLLTASTDPELLTKDEQGNVVLDSRKFLADNLIYPAAHFDVVLCWKVDRFGVRSGISLTPSQTLSYAILSAFVTIPTSPRRPAG